MNTRSVRVEDPTLEWAALTRGGARTDLGDPARPATYSRRDPHFAPMTNGQKCMARVRLLSAVGQNRCPSFDMLNFEE
jgi:hypothetical protein